MQLIRAWILGLLASCSANDRDAAPAPPAPASRNQPPTLSESEKQDLGARVIEQARAGIDAGTSPCKLPATIDRLELAGRFSLVTFGGKSLHYAVADHDGGYFAIHTGPTLRTGRTTLQARRHPNDFTRPFVVELVHSHRALEAVSGTLVIEKSKPVLVGHLVDAEFRERREEDFSYVANGCTTHVGRIDFQFQFRTESP